MQVIEEGIFDMDQNKENSIVVLNSDETLKKLSESLELIKSHDLLSDHSSEYIEDDSDSDNEPINKEDIDILTELVTISVHLDSIIHRMMINKIRKVSKNQIITNDMVNNTIN